MSNSECQKECVTSRGRELEIEKRLTSLESKMDAMNDKLDSAIVSQLKDHGKRIAELEKAKAYSTGWIVGASSVSGAVASIAARMF